MTSRSKEGDGKIEDSFLKVLKETEKIVGLLFKGGARFSCKHHYMLQYLFMITVPIPQDITSGVAHLVSTFALTFRQSLGFMCSMLKYGTPSYACYIYKRNYLAVLETAFETCRWRNIGPPLPLFKLN
jgi:hypothetical protein